jgi:oligopeptide transport system ATP-binding protein
MTDQKQNENSPLVVVDNLRLHFPVTKGNVFQRETSYVRAVDGVSFQIQRGETLGLVGESGSGKTTLGRTLLGLYKATSGNIEIDGLRVNASSGKEMMRIRRKTQMIFQDPYASLNPRWTVNAIVSEPLRVHKIITGKKK